MEKQLLTIDVSHGTTHDGPGMRTTIFVKGCSLQCLWCQNPESIGLKNEVWWNRTDCIGCGSCIEACSNQAISFTQDRLHIQREVCQRCGNCAEACPSTALSWQGQTYDMQTLLEEILRDRNYYRQFGGGVTCSGGEPLLQYAFLTELFQRLQQEGITTALDTCGCAPQKNLQTLLPFTDYVLYDIKLMDSQQHKKYTGMPNDRILENLLYLAEYARNGQRPIKIWIRTPLIPGITAELENIQSIASFIREHLLDVVERWELCAFNGLCATKYDKLERPWAFKGQGAMTTTQIQQIKQTALSVLPQEKVFISGMIREG